MLHLQNAYRRITFAKTKLLFFDQFNVDKRGQLQSMILLLATILTKKRLL
jgi:hypothetical protein